MARIHEAEQVRGTWYRAFVYGRRVRVWMCDSGNDSDREEHSDSDRNSDREEHSHREENNANDRAAVVTTAVYTLFDYRHELDPDAWSQFTADAEAVFWLPARQGDYLAVCTAAPCWIQVE